MIRMDKYFDKEIKGLESLIQAIESGIIPITGEDIDVIKFKLESAKKLRDIHRDIVIKNGFRDTYIFSEKEKKILHKIALFVHRFKNFF